MGVAPPFLYGGTRGFLGRVAALGVIVEMLVAIAMVHFRNGFFMNWAGTQAGEGFEYHVLYIALALPVMIEGAGAWSVDRRIARWLASHRPTAQGAGRLRPAHVH